MEWEDYINRYKNMILNVAIIVFALIISSNIYKAQSKELTQLKEDRERELKKNAILGDISLEDKKLKSYKSFLNKKDISLVIDKISDIAKDSNVKIVSVRPEAEQVFSLYSKHSFSFIINVNDYPALGKFINKLENSYDVYMVDSLNVSPRREGVGESIPKGLTVSLKIGTYLYRD